MPDWLGLAPRLVTTPARWGRDRIKKRFVDWQALVARGAPIITEVTEFIRRAGPVAAAVGTDQQIADRLHQNDERWEELRPRLLTYGNEHPSDDIQQLTEEVAERLGRMLGATIYLSIRSQGGDVYAAYMDARNLQDEAALLAEQLRTKVRKY
ncbi:MAG: hypothetical protein WD428_01050 [Gaiellaceae bacterium]